MSQDYTNISANNNGLPFPDTKAIDSTGPLATDGTEYLKETVDDVWLKTQAALDFYNFPPNGLDDAPGKDINGFPISQPLKIQYLNYGNPGTLVTLLWSFDPVTQGDPAILSALLGIDIRMLLLNGQGINRTNPEYLSLDLSVYVGDAENATADSFYHADDAAGLVRNIAGDYLILADMRGQFLRGLDEGSGEDPDGASRIVGDFQDDAMFDINGSFDLRRSNNAVAVTLLNVNGAFIYDENNGISNTFSFDLSAVGATNTDRLSLSPAAAGANVSAVENRPKSIAVRYAIYY